MRPAGWVIGVLLWALCAGATGLSQQPGNAPRVLVRCDDIGMCHSVNAALARVVETGLPISASIMFTCPWYQEAVELLKHAPHVSAGIHLTLNAEWANYRWGPVAGRGAVPSLTDSVGMFWPSRALFFQHHPLIEEVERELRAQIERALATGLEIDYLDYHMSTAVSTPEFRALLERLADEYQLGISRYFGEVDVGGVYASPSARKLDTLTAAVGTLDTGRINLMVFHIGLDSGEMQALRDLNEFGLAQMSRHRNAELDALTSAEFRDALRTRGVQLLTYRELLPRRGEMVRPVPPGE
jgi:predicted glycoside hydrolase/deacetylase ChbG (UPF0249 family)